MRRRAYSVERELKIRIFPTENISLVLGRIAVLRICGVSLQGVSWSVTTVSRAKTAEPIEMWPQMGPRKHY